MAIVLSIDDTALRMHVEQLLALIGQIPSDHLLPGCLEITDRARCSSLHSHAVVRLGIDVRLPEDDEVLLSLIDQALTSTRIAPVVCVVGACGRSGATRTVIRLVSRYRGPLPLTILDLCDDPLFPARLEVCTKPPHVLTWRAVDSEHGAALTRLGAKTIAIVSSAHHSPPSKPTEWIASIRHRGPVLIDAGRCSATVASMVRELNAVVYLSCRHATSTHIEAALTRLEVEAQRIFIPTRPPRNQWAHRAQWGNRRLDQRMVALLAGGESHA